MAATHVVRRRPLPARRRASLAIHAGLAAALVPAFVLWAPASSWDDPVLLLTLGALAVITDRHEIPLPSGVGFDALLALVLIAVATAGPLPALGLILVPWVVGVLAGREPLLRAGALANLAGYGWQAICGALVLQAAGGPGNVGALFAAGATLYVVGWAAGPAVYAPLWLGQPFGALTRAFADLLPAGAVMVALGATTVALHAVAGLPALALFALVAVLPQSALTFLARSRPVARLAPEVATRRYSAALAVQLGLPFAQRRHFAAVARAVHAAPPTGDPVDYALLGLRRFDPIELEAQLVTEAWDGSGGPAGLCAELIPVAARAVAVADTWSALTAAGGPELTHDEALVHLREGAGRRLDPRMVEAAAAVVAQERVSAREPAPEPRLHRLGVPRRLRVALAASAP